MAGITPAPKPEPSVPTGSRVVLVVSRGPEPGPRHGAAPVPELVGKPQGDALEHLQEVALNAQVFNDFSDRVKRGHVVDQFPVAGASVAVNSEVVVLVSNGPAEKTAPTPLPDVVGLHETEALSRLSSAGLESEVARDYHPNVAEGVVIAQLPSQAAVAAKPRGSLAWLWIAIAVVLVVGAAGAAFFLLLGKQVSVPDVTGRSQPQAEKILTAAGLKIGNVNPRTVSNVAVGTVLEQTPQAGVEVDSGSTVDLVVAEANSGANVPNLVGMNSSDAMAAISAAGFVEELTNQYSNTVPQGVVISQSPAAGGTAAKGSTVSISVSLGTNVTNVTLPNFVAMTQSAAVSEAVSLGLQARVSLEYSDTTPAGQVVDQIPDAGQSVAGGTTIGLSVSQGTVPATSVTLPDVTGQTSADAQNTLSGLGLVPTTLTWDGTGQLAGMVVGQSPKAGDQVAAGASVAIFVSSGK